MLKTGNDPSPNPSRGVFCELNAFSEQTSDRSDLP
jgi:hypothetical protein